MMTINEALRTILHTTKNVAKCELMDIRALFPHMPAELRNILIEYCPVCDTILRVWYIEDEDEMIDYDNPFYICDKWEHHVLHIFELQQQHDDMNLMEDECYPWD